jgi:type IV pilus assembly protein PilF
MLPVGMVGLLAGCVSEKSLKKADGHYREGVAAFRSGKEQPAFVSFQKATQENPGHKDAHYYLGLLYFQQGKYEEAERELRIVLGTDPEYSEAYTFLGQVLTQRGRWDEAIECYRQALANPLYETPDLARFHLGRALAHEGDMRGAIRVFEDALLVSPPSVQRPAVHLEIARAYYKLGEDDKARKALNEVTSLDEEGGPFTEAANQLLGRLRP